MFEKLVGMYIDWTTGADDTIRMSDWLCACFDADIDPDEVEEAGDRLIEESKEK